ncbi:permease [Cytobacillus gottheilii]|uniref:permease n=1 Tax=Cytobacillus gottheilii TaxID=859144 RepID=UPI003CFAECA2
MFTKWKTPISNYWFITFPIITLYTFSSRQSIILRTESENIAYNFWDVVLAGVSDLYLIVYFVFPLFLMKTGQQLTNSFDYMHLIRWGSFKKWILHNVKGFSIFNVFLLLIWNAASFAGALGLPFSFQWSELSRLDLDGNDILFTLSNHLSQPLYALILQFLLFFLTMLTIQLFLTILYSITKSKRTIYFSAAFLYVVAILSFKVFPISFKWILLPNYLSLFHGVASFNSIWFSFMIIILLFGIGLLALNYIGRDFRAVRHIFITSWPVLLFAVIVCTGLVYHASLYSDETLTIWDIWILTFYGTTNDAFQILSLSFYVIAFMGFVYFVQLILQKQLTEMSHYSIIRHKSLLKWFNGWFLMIMWYTGLFLLSLALLLFTISAGFDYSFSLHVELQQGLPVLQVGYHYFVNGFLQIIFYVLLVFLITWLTKDVMKSFVILLISILFMFPGMNPGAFIPVGLNSMGQLLTEASVYMISIQLLIAVVIEVIVLVYVLKKRDFMI